MKLAIRSASILLLICCLGVPARGDESVDPSQFGFVKAFSWGWVGSRGDYASPQAAQSMKELAETGADWVCIAFGADMKTFHDPQFIWGDENTAMASDDELRRAIDLARENGLKVILKPVVNCADGTWRAWIRFFRPVTDEERAAGVTGELDPWGEKPQMRAGEVTDQDAWAGWWHNYSAFLVHYAKIAQEKDVELFCLGCEMNSTEQFEDRWRALISQVREVFDGMLTYDINHGREQGLPWWDAVDVISVSAYYEVPPPPNVAVEDAVKTTTPQAEIEARLEGVKDALAAISRKWNKPILFIETGVTNVRGCARYPWSHPDEKSDSPLDETEQANYYQALFKVFWNEPWFMGFAWWDWPARLYDRDAAAEDRGFCVYGKQAEEVVREWYAKNRPSPEIPSR
jgi:Glycoside Hydrolase Family 113